MAIDSHCAAIVAPRRRAWQVPHWSYPVRTDVRSIACRIQAISARSQARRRLCQKATQAAKIVMKLQGFEPEIRRWG